LTDNQVKSCGCWFYKDEEVLLEEAKKRFFSKVEKTETCWIWKGSKIRGYGVLFYKQQIRAHRFSYMIHHGPLDKTKVICHKCDNPECVNPDHLYQGTTQENSRDASERNRIRTGSRHHKAKITEEDLKIILDRKYKGVDLAKIYGLSENHISFIRQGKSWKHVKTP
jgi:hypothetical protein